MMPSRDSSRSEVDENNSVHVCPLLAVHDVLEQTGARFLVTVINEHLMLATPGRLDTTNHLKLACNDISMPMAGLTAPEATHVEQLIAFARHWDRRGPLVIHCWAGISRSTAAAFATVCALNPQTSEAVIARDLRTASPHANPNRLLIALADEALGRGGRMIAAIEAMAPVSALASEGTPFLMASRYEFDRSSTGSF